MAWNTSSSVFLLLLLVPSTVAAIFTNKTGCGTTKACLFKPNGCDPNLDCTTGVIFYVIGPNKLRVEMVAAALIPSVQQQYVAMAFSHDTVMGSDAVTECTMSDMGPLAGYEPEIFVSFNKGKSNDRIFLNKDEQNVLFSDISSEVADGRLVCHFTQQIIPQIDDKNGMIWPLNRDYYIMAATGSAQPDEVNAHDMNKGSHFYPITSSHRINPAKLTDQEFELPKAHEPPKTSVAPPTVTSQRPRPTTSSSGSVSLILSILSISLVQILNN
ncbi:unnamed protein product [Auanema sp. JU1783]|nr:unnamed protein product [Auanema sp. JU1783]